MFARHDGRCRGHESDIGKPSLKRCFVIPPSLDVTFKVKRFLDLLRKSGEFFVMKEDLDDQTEAANEGI
jgi:hypothetical protein